MPHIKVTDMAYPRLKAPDLDVMEEFLLRFGMTRAARTPNALYMRGTDPAHHLHVTEKGEPKFVGFAYYAPSEDDLKRLAKAPGASGIEHLDEPGGGKRVRLTEPNGYQIEVVHGIASGAADPGQAPAAQLRRRPAGAAGRADAAAEGAVAGQAHRPWRDDDAEVRGDRRAGSARRSASSAPTTSMPARRTT